MHCFWHACGASWTVQVGWRFVNFATSGVLEGELMCDSARMAPRLRGMAADPALKAHGVSVVDYEQQLV